MVMTLVIMILFAQLWLFSIALDSMETRDVAPHIVITALICSFMGCAGIWLLIRRFLGTEDHRS
jgi:hypothetical protein